MERRFSSNSNLINSKFKIDMKKYICPAMQVEETQAAQMLAESLVIGSKQVDGSEALTKEENNWDIWDE
jgi:hypothetical protein